MTAIIIMKVESPELTFFVDQFSFFFMQVYGIHKSIVIVAYIIEIVIHRQRSQQNENVIQSRLLFFYAYYISCINIIALEHFLFYTFVTEEPNRMDSVEKYIDYNPPTQIPPGFENDFR